MAVGYIRRARAVAVVEYGIVMSRAWGGLSVGECCVIDRDSEFLSSSVNRPTVFYLLSPSFKYLLCISVCKSVQYHQPNLPLHMYDRRWTHVDTGGGCALRIVMEAAARLCMACEKGDSFVDAT